MEKLLMCRVCLEEDIRLVPIVGTHLQEMYESLVLMPFETEDGRPILACYICRARLKNCYELKKSCLQSEELFTHMLSCNESGQVQLQAINNKKRLTMRNVIHLSMGHVLGMDEDNVGVEALKCEVKDEPNDGEDISEGVLEENSKPSDFDDILSADSDSKNEKSMEQKMEADSDGAETLVLLCDVKDEQSDAEGASTPKEQTLQRISKDSTSSNLNKHEHHCDICKKQFSQQSNLTAHMRTHTANKPYYCDICQKKFTVKSNFTKHMRIHTGDKPHHCDICKKRFSQKSDFTRHMRTHTGEKPYQCDICKKQFSNRCSLTTHMRVHSGEKPHHCDICKKQFSEKGNFQKHMRTHTGEKPYQCDICKKQLAQKCSLTTHMRTHSGEKPHHCDICKKQFSQKSNFTIHMRTHTAEKPYYCEICHKKFSKQSHLTAHIRMHTGEKPYHCDICKKQFSERSNALKPAIHVGRASPSERQYQRIDSIFALSCHRSVSLA